MKIVFLGAPGAGKGTQAQCFCESKELAHISTGEILRKVVSSGCELGSRVKGLIDTGQLVPDSLMVELIEQRINEADCSKGYVLDGFPRTVAQAEALDSMLGQRGEALTRVVLFEVSEEELLGRLAHRREVETRADDTLETQQERLRVYQEQTAPLIGFYREAGLLLEVDADGSVEEIQARLIEGFDKE